MSGCECRDRAAMKGTPDGSKSAERKKKLDNAVQAVQDAGKRGFHGEVVFTYRNGTPEHVKVTETHKL